LSAHPFTARRQLPAIPEVPAEPIPAALLHVHRKAGNQVARLPHDLIADPLVALLPAPELLAAAGAPRHLPGQSRPQRHRQPIPRGLVPPLRPVRLYLRPLALTAATATGVLHGHPV